MLDANSSAHYRQPDKRVAMRRLVYKGSECVSALNMRVNSRRGLDELTFGTRQRSCQTRACDEFVERPYRCTAGGGPGSVCARIFQARTRRQSSLVLGGPYGVQRARNVASERRVVGS